MVTLREAISDSVRNFMCSAASDADPFRNWFAGATSSIPGVGSAAAAADNLGDAVAGLVCPGPDGGSGGGGAGATYPPSGPAVGQCPVAYFAELTVQFTYDDGSVLPPRSTSAQHPGPWNTSPVIETVTNNQGRPQTSVLYAYGDGAGNFGLDGGNGSNGATVTNFSLTRVDGLPDDCGETTPQQPPTGNDTIDYDGPDGQPVTNAPITINPTFPIIGPGGILNMPVEVCLLAICFDVNFNISTGDITFNFGGEAGASPCCPPIGDLPEDEGEGDPPPPDSETRYAGVITQCTVGGTGQGFTEKGDGVGPEIFVPSLGDIRFAVEVGGRRAWTVDQPIKSLAQYTKAPTGVSAYSWTVYPKKGVDIEVTGVPVVT